MHALRRPRFVSPKSLWALLARIAIVLYVHTGRMLVCFCVITHCALAAYAQVGDPVSPPPSRSGMQRLEKARSTSSYLGRGLDSVTGRPLAATCVQFGQISTGEELGQQTTYYKRGVRTKEDVFNSFGVSASASYSFIGGAVSASLDYARSFSSSRSERTLAIQELVLNTNTQGFSPMPTRTAIDAARTSPKVFFEVCGDSFIGAIRTGGMLNMFVKLRSQTTAEETSSQAAISANAGMGSGAISLTELMRRALASHEAVVDIFRNGTRDEVPSDNDIEKYALSFPPLVKPGSGGERILGFEATPYKEILELPPTVKPLVNQQRRYIEALGKATLAAESRAEEIDYVLGNSWQFDVFQADPLTAAKARLTEQIRDFTNRARMCYENLPAPCKEDPITPTEAVSLPPKVLAARLYSGTAERNFSMISTAAAIRGGSSRLLGFALVNARPGSQPLWEGGAVGPCEATRVYGKPHTSCQTFLGYTAGNSASKESPALYLGVVPNLNDGCVNSDPSFGITGLLGTSSCGGGPTVGSVTPIARCVAYDFAYVKP